MTARTKAVLKTKFVTGQPLADAAIDDLIDSFPGESGVLSDSDVPSAIARDAEVTAAIAAALPYKIYAALLAQTGTNAPVATVLQNTLVGTVVWTRDTFPGNYVGTLAGAFPATKTWLMTQGTPANDPITASFYRVSNDELRLFTMDASLTGIDFGVSVASIFIEIRIYP